MINQQLILVYTTNNWMFRNDAFKKHYAIE